MKKRNNKLTSKEIYITLKEIENEYNQYFIELLKFTIDTLLDKKNRKILFGEYFINNFHIKKFFINLNNIERKYIMNTKNIILFQENSILNENFNNYLVKNFFIKSMILASEEIYHILKENEGNILKDFVINQGQDKKNIGKENLGKLSISKYSHILNDILKLNKEKKINVKKIENLLLFEMKILLKILKLKNKKIEYNYIYNNKHNIIKTTINSLNELQPL